MGMIKKQTLASLQRECVTLPYLLARIKAGKANLSVNHATEIEARLTPKIRDFIQSVEAGRFQEEITWEDFGRILGFLLEVCVEELKAELE